MAKHKQMVLIIGLKHRQNIKNPDIIRQLNLLLIRKKIIGQMKIILINPI